MNEDEKSPDAVSLVDLIDRLAEPPEPLPISMMPQTVGWVVMALVLIALGAWLAWRWLRHWKASAYRRSALAELSACGDDPAEIADILRRTALAAWPRDAVASLTGNDWLEFLNRTGGLDGFSGKLGETVLAAPYRSQPKSGGPELHALASQWIRQHRVSGPGSPP